jgi:hypothetical protein
MHQLPSPSYNIGSVAAAVQLTGDTRSGNVSVATRTKEVVTLTTTGSQPETKRLVVVRVEMRLKSDRRAIPTIYRGSTKAIIFFSLSRARKSVVA